MRAHPPALPVILVGSVRSVDLRQFLVNAKSVLFLPVMLPPSHAHRAVRVHINHLPGNRLVSCVALVPISRKQGKVRVCPAVPACTAQQPVSPSKLESVWQVLIPQVPPRLRLVLRVLWVFFRIKPVKSCVCLVVQVHFAQALVFLLSAVCALQDRSLLRARLSAPPAPRASTAQLMVLPPSAVIALLVLSQPDPLHPLPVLHVLLDFTVPQLASKHASPAPLASIAQLLVFLPVSIVHLDHSQPDLRRPLPVPRVQSVL